MWDRTSFGIIMVDGKRNVFKPAPAASATSTKRRRSRWSNRLCRSFLMPGQYCHRIKNCRSATNAVAPHLTTRGAVFTLIPPSTSNSMFSLRLSNSARSRAILSNVLSMKVWRRSRVDGHHQHQVHLRQDFINHTQGCGRLMEIPAFTPVF